MTNYVLVSFKGCPWVQRVAIVLREKSIPFTFAHIEADKRPVSAVADQVEVRDVLHVRVRTDFSRRLELRFDPEYALDDRIVMEQFLS